MLFYMLTRNCYNTGENDFFKPQIATIKTLERRARPVYFITAHNYKNTWSQSVLYN